MVAHSLAYATAAKNGITESEIEDLISLGQYHVKLPLQHNLWIFVLDDVVLDDIYQYHLPPTRRVPPLLWARIRSHVSRL